MIGCDIANRDLTLINNTPYKVHYRIYFDTVSVKSDDWYIGDVIEPYDTIQPHTVFGGKGALEYSMKSQNYDSSLFIFYTTTNITNESDLVLSVEEKKYKKLKYTVSSLKKNNWIIHLVE